MQVSICTPCGDDIKAATADCLLDLTRYTNARGIKIAKKYAQSSVPSQNQNKMIWDSLHEGSDAVMLIDSDMVFPNTALMTMLDRNVDIVGAPYVIRKPPFHLTFIPLDRGKVSRDVRGLVEAEHVASGLTLIRRQVIETMHYPWMEEIYGESPDDLIGHDVYFCRKARKMGFRVWADFDVAQEVAHLGVVPLGLAMAK